MCTMTLKFLPFVTVRKLLAHQETFQVEVPGGQFCTRLGDGTWDRELAGLAAATGECAVLLPVLFVCR